MLKPKRKPIKGLRLRQNWEEMLQKGITLVDFNAPWCAPCRAQKPIVDKLAGRYRGRMRVLEVDVDENPKVAMRLGITSIPTLIIFKDGKEIEHFVGLQSAEVLSEAIEKMLD